ncbi:unnamed protein product [Schistosoma turkestanicum]|nr:unnamed protein product [Schistosoma turkestanicum]
MKSILQKSWLLILLLKLSHFEIDAKITIDDSTGHFVDSQGFVKLFHGINCVPKVDPYYYPTLLEPSSMKQLTDWGFNAIRLELSWFALKPFENVTNSSYLNIIEKIIDNAGLYGIYVIIDLHQDGLSERLGAIDSAPYWFMDKISRPWKTFEYPWPLTKEPGESDWFLTYATYESAHVFESIYRNVSGLWKYFGEYWRLTVKRFGKKENVLGYNLINEPAPGNYYINPFLLIPYNSGHYLLSFYDYLVNIIRETDNNTLIFYESVTYGIYFPFVYGIPGTGIQRVPGLLRDETARKKSVFSYHYYCWILQSNKATDDIPSWKRYVCEKILNYTFSNVQNIVASTGGGRFLTEFGLCLPDGNPNSINTVECNAVLNAADSSFESWTYWDEYELYPSILADDYSLRSLSRTYPQSTAGQPLQLQFNVETGVFYYKFIPALNSCKNMNTEFLVAEIFVPLSIHYPNGIRTHFAPEKLYYRMHETNTNLMLVYASCTLIDTNLNLIEITISPNQTENIAD